LGRKGVSEALAAAFVLGSIIVLLLPIMLELPKVISPKPVSPEAKTLFVQAATGYAMQNLMNVYAVLVNSSGVLTLRIEIIPRSHMVIERAFVWSPPYLARISTSPPLPVAAAPGATLVIDANVTRFAKLLARGVATLLLYTGSGAVIRAPIVSTSTLQRILSSYSGSNTTPSYAYTLLTGALLSRLSNENLTQSLSQLFYIGNVTTQNSQLLEVPTRSNPGEGMESNYPLVLLLDLKNVTVWSGYVSGYGSVVVEPMNSNMLFVGKSSDGKYVMFMTMVNFGYSPYYDVYPEYMIGYCTSTTCDYVNLYYLCPAGARIKIMGFTPEEPPLGAWLYPYTLRWELANHVYAECWGSSCVGTNQSAEWIYIIPPTPDTGWTYYGVMDSFAFYGHADEVRIYCRYSPSYTGTEETSYEPYLVIGNFGFGYGLWFVTNDDGFGWNYTPNDVLKGYYYTYDLEDASTKPLVLISKSPVINNSEVYAVDIGLVVAFMDDAADDAAGTSDNGQRPIITVGLVDADTGQIVSNVSIPFSVLTRVEDTYPPHVGLYSTSIFIPVPPPSTVGSRKFLVFVSIRDPYFMDYGDYLNDIDYIVGLLYLGVLLYGR